MLAVFYFGNTQAEAKKLEDSSLYLNLPATKVELEEKGYSATGKSTQNLGNCTISKDFFQISTLVCSTKLTQNGKSELEEVVIYSPFLFFTLCAVFELLFKMFFLVFAELAHSVWFTLAVKS